MNLMNAIRGKARRVAHRVLFGSAAFDAASFQNQLSNWVTSDEDVNSLATGNIGILRSRSRDLFRKNAQASGALEEWVSECVGNGITPTSLHPDRNIRILINEAWARWVERADPLGYSDFYGLQALAVRSTIESGESLSRIRIRRPQDGLPIPVQIQTIESDYLPAWKNETLPSGSRIYGGVEVDPVGRRTAYHIFREHPGSNAVGSDMMTIRVVASSIVHTLKVQRPGQVRGLPWLVPVMAKLFDIGRYDETELIRKKITALFVGTYSEEDTGSLFGGTTDKSGNQAKMELAPGVLLNAGQGRVEFSSPPSDASNAYESYMRQQLQSVAKGIGLTYEQVTGDLRGVTYSSIRAGLIAFRRRCAQQQQNIVVFQYSKPIWRRVIRSGVLSGDIGISLSGFNADPESFLRAKWRTPRWEWVDPLKDVQARIAEVNAGFRSRSSVIQESGSDPEEVDRQIAEEREREKDLKIQFNEPEGSDKKLTGVLNMPSAASGDISGEGGYLQ